MSLKPDISNFWVKHPYQSLIRGAFFIVLLVALVFCVSEYNHSKHSETTRGEKSAKERTDEALALYTLWLMLFTGVLAVSTVGLWLTTRRGMRVQALDMKRSVDAAIRAVEIAQKAATADNRAWLKIEIKINKSHGILIDESGVTTAINFCVVNVGNAPALNATVTPVIVVQRKGIGPAMTLRRLCEEIRNGPERPGFAVFPGEHHPERPELQSEGISCARSDLEEHYSEAANGERIVSLYIMGCVAYSVPSDPEIRHVTGFIYDLFRVDMKFWNIDRFEKVNIESIYMSPPIDIADGRPVD